MASSQTKVVSGALEKAAQSLASHVDSYNTIKSSLQSSLDQSSSTFQGEAGNAFRESGSSWTSSAANTAQQLEEIQAKLQKAGVKFQAADEAGKGAFGGSAGSAGSSGSGGASYSF
ncbi:MAG: WXG100 family type VII secretion target [Segniliparus sp.]|uniref:WXG100 family type VII secretion target n=1 Tax=Segniliparus sp. TaxID=2804064 RepID=UPI003F3C1871